MSRELPGHAPLQACAIYIMNPTWIDEKPAPNKMREVVWIGQSTGDVPIHVCRDGFIVFDFPKAPTYAGGGVPEGALGEDRKIPKHITNAQNARTDLAYKRFDYMNAFLLALYSAYSSVQKLGTPVQPPVNPVNYFVAEERNGEWVFHQEFIRDLEYPSERHITQLDTAKHAVELMHACEQRFKDDYIEILKLTHLACHQYAVHQFSSAHIIAWTVVEKLLSFLWSDLLNDADAKNGGHTAISKDRREMLNGRDYSISVVSQVLSLNGKIDDNMLTRLDIARRKRNAFAHSLEPILGGDAGKTIRLATDLITNLAAFRVTSQLSLSFYL